MGTNENIQSLINEIQTFYQIQMSQRRNYQSWQQLCQRCVFDIQYGFLIPQTYSIKTFDDTHITAVLKQINNLIGDKALITMVKQVPEINCQQLINTKDLFILKQMLSYILMGYLQTLKRTGQELKVPANIARPYHYAIQKLQIKYGFGSGISYNWKLKSSPKHLHQLKACDHIQLKWHVTKDAQNQRLLMGYSATISIFMFRVLSLCHQVAILIHDHPEREALIAQKLRKIAFWIYKASDENISCLQNLSGQFMVKQFSSVIKTSENVYLEGVDIQIKLISGNAGYDPTFNAFEAAMGMDFSSEKDIVKMKQHLKEGIIKCHLEIKNWMEENSLIRQYCDVTSFMRRQYNKILNAYSMFFKTHSYMILNKLERSLPSYNKNLPVQKSPFQVIYKKSILIDKQLLKI